MDNNKKISDEMFNYAAFHALMALYMAKNVKEAKHQWEQARSTWELFNLYEEIGQ